MIAQNIIEQILEVRNWSQSDLARELSISRQSISEIVKVEVGITISKLIDILIVTGCELRIDDNSTMTVDKVKEVINDKMKNQGVSIKVLTECLGYKSPVSIQRRIKVGNGADMSTEKLYEITKELGLEVIVRDRMGTGSVWVLDDYKETEEDKKLREFKRLKAELEEKGVI